MLGGYGINDIGNISMVVNLVGIVLIVGAIVTGLRMIHDSIRHRELTESGWWIKPGIGIVLIIAAIMMAWKAWH